MSDIFGKKSLDRRVRDVEDVEMLSSIPIYGVLPNRDINDIKFYDSLRWVGANLQFMTREGDKSKKFNLINIDGEGKTK